MFSSMLRQAQSTTPRRAQDGRRRSHSPSLGPASRDYARPRHATADFTEADDDDDDDDDASDDGYGLDPYHIRLGDEDGPSRVPVLPLFSSGYLGEASPPILALTPFAPVAMPCTV